MQAIYFLGGGNMCAAIVSGLVKQSDLAITVVDANAEKLQQLKQQYGIETAATMPPLHPDAVLVLAVKPQDMQTACANLAVNGALVLSIAAGLDVATLSHYLNGHRRLVRVMPNTPAQVGLGVSGLFAAPDIGTADRQLAERIMQAVGQTVWLPEEARMHAITGISGSGPAYVFYLLDALQQAAQAQGFNADEARLLSLATFEGAVALAAQSGLPFAQLQQNVTSKGGTTHEAIETFKAHQVAEAIAAGVTACCQRSEQLQQIFAQAAQQAQ